MIENTLCEIDYKIDKDKYSKLYWDNEHLGSWHPGSDPEHLFWWRVFVSDQNNVNRHEQLAKYTDLVAEDLNIQGMDNYPRFNYYHANHRLAPHTDDDNIVAININLLNTVPVVHVGDAPHSFECLLLNVGKVTHSIEPDPNPRLTLKFCLRHPWEEVCERLDAKGLLIT